jgi:tellurite resistance protein TehA-like permease
VGFFVVGWAMSDLGKYLIITLTSFVACVLLYEYLVCRFNVLRVSFGMKPLRRSARPTPTVASVPQMTK